VLRRSSISLIGACLVLASLASAQEPTAQPTAKVTLDVSETLFSVITAMNSCGYDQELSASDPVRLRIRAEVSKKVEDSPSARYAERDLCAFYHDHQQPDYSRDLSQYLSLALNLGAPPAFAANVKEADMPPDAAYVLGVQPLLQRFYIDADLHSIWLRHNKDYEALADRNREAVSKMLMATDVYLKLPVGGYSGRSLSIFLEPMAAPSQTNARNYDTNYFMVVSPEQGEVGLDQIRHTYLHFILDPMTMKRGTTMKRLAPLLNSVKTAPIDESFKSDVTLLLTESLIRAIEARTSKGSELEREQKAEMDAREGFILAPYFYDQLVKFEKDPVGLNDAYGDWLYYIDVAKEQSRASHIQFAASSAPDVLRPAKRANPLAEAELSLSSGDLVRARDLAQRALDSHQVEPGRAYFLLARISTSAKDPEGAQKYFEKAIEVSRESRVVAWSHIYLGRIYDLKSERETALQHYHAALQTGDSSAYTKAAAERGLKEPYQLPVRKIEGTQTQEKTN